MGNKVEQRKISTDTQMDIGLEIRKIDNQIVELYLLTKEP